MHKELQTEIKTKVIYEINNLDTINITPRIAYDTAKIGNQVWMSNNLSVKIFRNGDSIYHAKTKKEWIEIGQQKKPAYFILTVSERKYKSILMRRDSLLNLDTSKRGKWIIPKHREYYLYNWYAVNDERGLAPKGWVIPELDDYIELITHIGGLEYIRDNLLSKEGWREINNDPYGLNIYPAPYIESDGRHYFSINSAKFWTKSVSDKNLNSSIIVSLRFGYSGIGHPLIGTNPNYYSYIRNRAYGFSIRCLCDSIIK